MPPIMIVRSEVPGPAADPAVEPPAPAAPVAPLLVALFAQPARASEPTAATRAIAFHREQDIVISFRSKGGVQEHVGYQTAVISAEPDGGRQRRMRFSSRVMSVSATRAMTATMTIPARTPFMSKLFWELLISSPRPWLAPRISPTRAPIRAKPKLMCRLARIQVKADGRTTCRVTCSREAPRIRALEIRLRSTSRVPWNALKKTPKKTSTTASTILDSTPNPKATVKIEPRMIRGMELATLMNGDIRSAISRLLPRASTTPMTKP